MQFEGEKALTNRSNIHPAVLCNDLLEVKLFVAEVSQCNWCFGVGYVDGYQEGQRLKRVDAVCEISDVAVEGDKSTTWFAVGSVRHRET